MALAAQPGGHPSWGRWPQQATNDYTMVDNAAATATSTGGNMMVYGSRAEQAPDMMNSSFIPHQYMVPSPYSSSGVPPVPAPHYHGASPPHPPAPSAPAPASYPSTSSSYGHPASAPAPAAPAPHHQHQHHGHYQHLMSPSSTAPYRHDYHSHHQASQPQTSRSSRAPAASSMAPIVHKDDVKPFIRDGHMSPPLSRRGSEISMDKPMTNPTLHAKTITANATLDPKDRVEFDTNVDQLMRAIQGDNDTDSHAMTPAPSPCVEEVSARSSPASCAGSTISNGAASKQRKYTCDGPNCNKSFTQKTHLDIHKRTHTGNRPYTCTFEGCNLTFSQLGNLKTHERRHTGVRPFKCGKCDKRFAQRGNVKSHEETHEGKKPFRCLLANCGKTFSQLGNMKTHQNNFHKDVLDDLTAKFIQFTNEGYVPEEYRTLFDYFKLHYKNSNKGIKGRGKARKIAGGDAQSPRKANTPSAPSSRRTLDHSAYTVSHGSGATSAPSMAESVPRSNGGYGTAAGFPVQHAGAAPPMFYDDHHGRHLAFPEQRFY